MKRFFPILAIVLVAALAAPEHASADTFVVAPPFKIQDAINLALINAAPTDTITVQPGTYAESLLIDFTGTNQEALVIIRNTSTKPKITGGVLIRDSQLVTFHGFKVDSTHDDGVAAIRVLDSSAVAIVDCSGYAGDDGGVAADDTFEVVVDDCDFSGMDDKGGGGFAVRILGRSNHLVRDTVTDGNDGLGIWLDGDRSTIRKCQVRDNGGGGILIHGLRNTVRDSNVSSNGGWGVYAYGECTIKKNSINANTGQGVRYGDGATAYTGGQIKDNKIKHNIGNGIVIRGSQDGCQVTHNKVYDNGGIGIHVVGLRTVLLENLVKRTSKGVDSGHGIEVNAASLGNSLEDNLLADNTGEGIWVAGTENFLILNQAKGDDGIIDATAGLGGNNGHANKTDLGVNDFP